MIKEKVDPRKEEYTKKFKLELFEFIKGSKHENHIITQKINEIEALFKDKVYLTGKLFYDLYKKHSFNFDVFCKKVFHLSKARKISQKTKSSNLLALLINPFLNSQKSFYSSADIGSSRLNRILSLDKQHEIYADEVYGIAVAIGVEPLVLFEYLFEDAKYTTYDLALKILELYVTKEKEQLHESDIKADTPTTKDPLNNLVNKLFELIKEKPGQRNPFFQKELQVSEKTIQRGLKELKMKDKIEFRGAPKNGGYWVKE